MNRNGIVVLLSAIFLLGALAWLAFRGDSPHERAVVPVTSAEAPREANADREVLYWYDPMRPDVHFDKHGNYTSMDMPLKPKYANPAGGSERQQMGLIEIDPRMAQNLG